MAARRQKLSDLGEDALVDLLVSGLPKGRDVVVGPGDDCAVVRTSNPESYALLKTDCIVEGVHYTSDAKPIDVGWKAMARTLSDIAAMGGVPRHALVTIAMPPDREVAYVRGIYRGLAKASKRYGVSVVGGETSSAGQGMISVSTTGSVARGECAIRSGGRGGDVLFVTGRLGGSLKGRHLRFEPRLDEARWLVSRFRVRAMMDLSDGLAKDLPRLADASGVGFEIEPERLPRTRGCSIASALGDGEDYELLIAVRRSDADALETSWKKRFPRLLLTRVGRLTTEGHCGIEIEGGWEHFRK